MEDEITKLNEELALANSKIEELNKSKEDLLSLNVKYEETQKSLNEYKQLLDTKVDKIQEEVQYISDYRKRGVK